LGRFDFVTNYQGEWHVSTNGQDKQYTETDGALKYAWGYFIEYDNSANQAKKWYFWLRAIIILLILATSVAAVISSLPILSSIIPADNIILKWIVFLLPIGTALLLQFLEFTPAITWIYCRVLGERIRKEIYLYRTGAGAYSQAGGEQDQKKLLRESVKKIVDQITSTLSSPPKQVSEKTLAQEVKRRVHASDDGFIQLKPGQYRAWRAKSQHEYYQKQIDRDFLNLRRSQALVIVLGGLGTLLGGLSSFVSGGWERYIVVLTALSTGLVTYSQFAMHGQMYSIYLKTADNIKFEMEDLPSSADAPDASTPKQLDAIAKIEQYLDDDREQWKQLALRAQSAGNERLTKMVGDIQKKEEAKTTN
jgi:hypothetical protein